MYHFKRAIDEHKELKEDEEIRDYLKMYFQITAFYIVAASEYIINWVGGRIWMVGGYGYISDKWCVEKYECGWWTEFFEDEDLYRERRDFWML